MISKKDKKIVDAVNFFEGEFVFMWGQKNSGGIILEATSDSHHDDCPEKAGDFCGGFAGYNKTCRELVCTQDEYNQCIREMSAGKFVTPCELTEDQAKRLYANIDGRIGSFKNGHEALKDFEIKEVSFSDGEQHIKELIADTRKPEFEYGQKVYVSDVEFKYDELTFGCYHPDGYNCLLTFADGYGCAAIENVSATPFKSKEEIELEEAKRKQVDDNVNIYGHYFDGKEDAEYMFENMQMNGRLSEILLPMEDK